jgi:hypothetical protein
MRLKPNSRSSALMRRDNVDAGIPSAAAARLKLRVLATSTNNAKSAGNRTVFPFYGSYPVYDSSKTLIDASRQRITICRSPLV